VPVAKELAEVLESFGQARIEGVHFSCPGIVQEYDHDTQTAKVLPAVRRPVRTPDGTVLYEDHPVIPGVPIAWPKGGGYGFHCPLSKGDRVMLVFSDLTTSEHRTTGEVSEPFDLRLHGLGCPTAIPCDITEPGEFSNLASDNKARIGKDGDDAQVEFDSGSIHAGRGASESLAFHGTIKGFMDALKAFCDDSNTANSGMGWSSVADVKAAANTLKGALGGTAPTPTTVAPFGTDILKAK